MEECKEGDYFRFKQNIFVALSDWKTDRIRKFNRLRCENIEDGLELRISSKKAESCYLLSEEDKKKCISKRINVVSRALIKDKKLIKQVKESLEAVFPGNWDFTVGKSLRDLYTVTIKFPYFKIVNGKNEEHEIHDLYVQWIFTKGFIKTHAVQGIRGCLSYVEYKCGYLHSHLPSHVLAEASSNYFRPFCLGSGDFADLNSEWSLEDRVFDQGDFELLLYQLDAYVKWESLQGGPYMRISAIGVGSRYLILSNQVKNLEFQIVVNSLDDFPLKFDHLNNRFKVNFASMEERLVKANLQGLTKIRKTPKGDYIHGDVTFSTIEGWIKEGNEKFADKPLLHFRGEDVYLEVMELKNNEKNSNLMEVPHPDITKYIVQQLTRKTNNYFIKTYGK